MSYQNIEVKTFKEVGNNGVLVYFTKTENYALISIPAWNWCYLWDYSISDEQLKQGCIEALSDPMFREEAEQLTERFYQYLLWNK
jgi:hypothetical protein